MMSHDANERDVLAGEYVLGLLSRAQAEEFERRLSVDVDLRDRVEAWEARFAPALALAFPLAPEPSLWQRIETLIKSERVSRSVAPEDGRVIRKWIG